MKHDIAFYHTPAFTRLLRDIEEQVYPEKIFLLSACSHLHYAENIFIRHPIKSDKPSQYDILVLSAENEQRSNDMLQDIIENKCSEPGYTTALILPIHQFNKWLMNGHPFAYKVYHAAQLCFDAEKIPLAIPHEYTIAEVYPNLHLVFNRCIQIAIEFISGAELFTIRRQLPLAAFHLHQAAEQLYTGIIQLITGLRVQTHNLDKLYRYSRHLAEGLADIFPCNNPREKQLFKLLQKAYIESRYGNEYKIKEEDVVVLHKRVLNLLEIAEPMKKINLAVT
jgi:uncharacterized protein